MVEITEIDTNAYFGENGINVVLVGNPGIGKSTICSSACYNGPQFESGLSFEGGLTKEMQFSEVQYLYPSPEGKGKLAPLGFCDTAGLAEADQEEINNNAKTIMDAFRKTKEQNRGLKIIFLCSLESGRVKMADLYTINSRVVTLPDPKLALASAA